MTEVPWPVELDRPFDAVILDWDGTAVARRDFEARDLAEAIERLLERRVPIAVVAGTHSGHIERQLVRLLEGARLEDLFLLVNRGSEAYGFLSGGSLRRLDLRQASEEEERSLDRAAAELQRLLSREFRLDVRLVSDRLNRRKLDLIPLQEWEDPPKAEIARLSGAVRARLSAAGVPGFRWIFEKARELAQASGLADPRITTDLKHIEIGLSDKSRSAGWFVENVLRPRGIPASATAVLGDEFGGPEGIAGSDSCLRIPALEGAAWISVGVEPFGVPDGVVAAPGGPERLLDFLDLQLARREWGMSSDPVWCVEQDRFDPGREREMEAIFTVSNGSVGLRGALELGLPGSEADLYLAGVYDAKAPVIPYSEAEFLAPARNSGAFAELVSLPFPLRLKARVDGRPLELREGREHHASRKLDLRAAILQSRQEFPFDGGTLGLCSRRLASAADSRLILHELEIRAEGRALELELEFGVDFSDFHLRHPHLLLVHPAGEAPWSTRGHDGLSELVLAETRHSQFLVGLAARTCVDGAGAGAGGRGWSGRIEPGVAVRIRRVVAAASSRDAGFRGKAPSLAEFEDFLVDKIQAADPAAFHSQIGRHRRNWREFWRRADIPFSGSAAFTESQRFNAYHLRSAAPQDPHSSIPARGLSGRGYEGHVFWDSETFMLPFFNLLSPAHARRMLEYRHQTLDGARRRAREMGFRGACYAWESTVDGRDVTPDRIVMRSTGMEIPIFTGSQQMHVTADIAHGIWQYWFCTGDSDFLKSLGAEILFETARFWSSRCSLEAGRYHIDGVVGPDEYHHGVRDNAYTNWMARFNLDKALWARDWLLENDPRQFTELSARIGLFEEELRHWEMVARQLFVPVPGTDGVIEQFEGFFGLADVGIEAGDRIRAPVNRLLDWRRINRSRICKQADVLMLPFLFPEEFSAEVTRANYDYYEPITDHGSSLSLPVHACIAARLGRREQALSYYSQAVELDLFNLMENTSLGVHAACMAGSWQALVFGFLGVRLTERGPVVASPVSPAMPKEWGNVRCRLEFRGVTQEWEVSAA